MNYLRLSRLRPKSNVSLQPSLKTADTIGDVEENFERDIREKVLCATIPLQFVYGDKRIYQCVSRFAYLDSIATRVMMNNYCPFTCTYLDSYGEIKECDQSLPIGVIYDLVDPTNIPWTLTFSKMNDKNENVDGYRFTDSSSENAKGSSSGKNEERIYHTYWFWNGWKQVDYLETAKIGRISSLSKKKAAIIENDIGNSKRLSNVTKEFILPQDRLRFAVKVHFRNGQTVICQLERDSHVFGLIQGIVISKMTIGNIQYLRNVDGWFHVCLPTAKVDVDTTLTKNKGSKVKIKFQAVAGSPVLKNSMVEFQKGMRMLDVKEYLQKTSITLSKELYLYVHGMFETSDQEHLYNLCFDDNNLTLFYSTRPAWS